MQVIRVVARGLLLLSASFSTGCATILHGPTKSIVVTSDPSGAEIVQDGQFKGRTPTRISYSSMTKDLQLHLRLTGYRDQEVDVDRNFDPIAILNCGSFLCWGVDVLTGAMWRFDEPQVAVRLERLGATPSGPGAPGNPPPPSSPPPDAAPSGARPPKTN